jgi:hypothetical protein
MQRPNDGSEREGEVSEQQSNNEIRFGSREYWQALTNIVPDDRIYRGLRVTVEGGRKHKGRTGSVTVHKQSPYEHDVFRYASGASLDLRLMRGRDGFVALVTPDDDGHPKPFWVPCKHLMPLTDPVDAISSLSTRGKTA